MKRAVLMSLSVVLALIMASPMAFGQVGQGAVASGAAGKLDAAWWSWAVSTPKSQSPLIGGDPNYSEAQCNGQPVTEVRGNKWFLAGSPGQLSEDGGQIISGSGDERTCTVPTGAELFFPIVNNLCATPVDADTPQQLSECAETLTNDMLEDASYYVRVDGQDVEAKRIVRAQSSPYTINFADDNVFAEFGYVGEQTAASAGLYVALPPLSEGEHTIEWAGIFDYEGGPIYEGGPVYPYFQFAQETTYHITVE